MSVSSKSIEMDKGSEMKPYQKMRGHTDEVRGVAHLPDGQRIITCSSDGSLRLWERESGAQVGNNWRDGEDKTAVWTIALSPNGKTVSSGSIDGTMRLWDVEMRKVIAKWTGHTEEVRSVCWSADGGRVASGSFDGTATVWHVESGETVLGPMKTGHQYVTAVAFSPDASNLATGGYNQHGIKIWDGRTGELLSTLNHDSWVWSLVWTSDQKKLLAGNNTGSITIFNTATWQQIAVLEDHTNNVVALSLFQNDRLLASGSYGTARLWNLDTNLPVGPPLQHQHWVEGTAFSPDGRFLATACGDHNGYVWDVYTILQEGGLEHLLSAPNVTTGKSILNSDATRRPTKPKEFTVVPQGFFDSSTPCTDPPPSAIHTDPPPASPLTDLPPSPAYSDSPPSTPVRRHALAPFTVAGARALLGRVFPSFRRSQPGTVEPMDLQQVQRPDVVPPHGPAGAQVPAAQGNQLDNPPSPPHNFVDDSQDHIHPSATPTPHIQPSSSSSIRNRRDAQLEGAPPESGPRAVVDRFLPRFRRPQSNIDTSMELQQHPMQNTISGRNDPAVIEVPEMRDRQTLYVAPPPKRVHRRRKNTWLARCLVFICCEPAEENSGI